MRKKKIYLQAKRRYLKRIVGTEVKPRLAVYRSHAHIYGQIINDKKGHTLCSMSSISRLVTQETRQGKTQAQAFKIGQKLGKMALDKNINKIIFDSGKRKYHGRIKSLADGARSAGLLF